MRGELPCDLESIKKGHDEYMAISQAKLKKLKEEHAKTEAMEGALSSAAGQRRITWSYLVVALACGAALGAGVVFLLTRRRGGG